MSVDLLETRHQPLSDHDLDQLFRKARTFNGWSNRDISDADLKKLYDLMKFGPTSANQCPARFVFLKGEAKQRLKPHLLGSNVDKTMAAPVTVIIAWDWEFHEKIPKLFPHAPEAKDWFESEESRKENGFRNGTLQGAYLILAARALGIDSGGMSGFDQKAVDEEFFKNDPDMKHWRSNFLLNLGYGTTENLFPRSPRLAFDEAAKILS